MKNNMFRLGNFGVLVTKKIMNKHKCLMIQVKNREHEFWFSVDANQLRNFKISDLVYTNTGHDILVDAKFLTSENACARHTFTSIENGRSMDIVSGRGRITLINASNDNAILLEVKSDKKEGIINMGVIIVPTYEQRERLARYIYNLLN